MLKINKMKSQKKRGTRKLKKISPLSNKNCSKNEIIYLGSRLKRVQKRSVSGKFFLENYECEYCDGNNQVNKCNFRGKIFSRKNSKEKTFKVMRVHSQFCQNKGKINEIYSNKVENYEYIPFIYDSETKNSQKSDIYIQLQNNSE